MGIVRTFFRLQGKRLKRLPMSVLLRGLARWQPLTNPKPGYTVVISCMRALAPVAIANLRLCAQMRHERLHEVILVFDCPVGEVPPSIHEAAASTPLKDMVRIHGYTAWQTSVTRWINWGWVYAWLSWSLAIGQSQTRAVILHDLDALPLNPDLFEDIYDHWLAEEAQFCGIRAYEGNGVSADMRLVTTFELALDAGYLRQSFRPFDLFNKLAIHDGRIVDFDTMLHAQLLSEKRAICPVDERKLVHPSQLICQYTDLISRRSDFHGRRHMLPILIYFLHLGGDPTLLRAATPPLEREEQPRLSMFGRSVPVEGLAKADWAWIEKQIRRVEQHCFGSTRPEVADYLKGISSRAGDQRTVGAEVGPYAVPDL